MTNNKIQAADQSFSLSSVFLPNNRTTPLPDDIYFKMMTVDEKGHSNPKLVEIVLKYYPELRRFHQEKSHVCVSSRELINELLDQYALPELEFS